MTQWDTIGLAIVVGVLLLAIFWELRASNQLARSILGKLSDIEYELRQWASRPPVTPPIKIPRSPRAPAPKRQR